MSKTTKELMAENTKREKQLAPENQTIYTNMIVYIRGANLSDQTVEQVRSEITEMLLDAQLRGENIEQVFGENYKEICDEIIEALPEKTRKEKIIDYIDIFFRSFWRLALIVVVTSFIGDIGAGENITGFQLTSGHLISMAIIILTAYGLVAYISKTAFKDNETKKQTALEILGIFLIMLLILLPTILFKTVLFEMSYVTAALLVALLFGVSKIVEHKVAT